MLGSEVVVLDHGGCCVTLLWTAGYSLLAFIDRGN